MVIDEKERAELQLLRDQAKRLLNFDGGPEVAPWWAIHRLHETEPYIGCPFCRDQFGLMSDWGRRSQAMEEVFSDLLDRYLGLLESSNTVVKAQEFGEFGIPEAVIEHMLEENREIWCARWKETGER